MILDLQRSLRRLGRIRMGQRVPTSSGKMRPAKLETWRLTSASAELLEAAAAIYGGSVTEWSGAPTSARQWELLTTADTLDVLIPAGDMAFSQWYELWSAGGCQRRCDGRTEQMTGEACMCPADAEERQAAAAKPGPEACKPTTRLFVILPRIPDLGMWHLESHGYYAAVELAGSVELLRMAGANMVPAGLRIDQRAVKRNGETRNYAVPVIELPTLSTHTLMTGEVTNRATPELADAASRVAPSSPPAPAGTPRRPVEAPALPGEVAAPEVRAELRGRIAAIDDPDALARLRVAMRAYGSLRPNARSPLLVSDLDAVKALIAEACSARAPAIHTEVGVSGDWLDQTAGLIEELALAGGVDTAQLFSAVTVYATDGRTTAWSDIGVSDQAAVAEVIDCLRRGELTLEDTPDGPELVYHSAAVTA